MKSHWLQPRDLLSVECLFVLFLFAGAYKELFETVLVDVDATVATCGTSIVFTLFVYLKRGRRLLADQLRFAMTYGLFLVVAATSYLRSEFVDLEATTKIEKLLVFNTWSLCAPLFVINTPERVDRLVRLVLAVSIVAVFQALVAAPTAEDIRFVGAFGTSHYHALGHAAGMCSVISLAIVLTSRQQIHRLLGVCLATTAVFAMCLSGARQAVIGVLPAALYLLPLVKHRRIRLAAVARFVFLAALVLAVFLYISGSVFSGSDLESVWARMATLSGGNLQEVLQDSERLELWADGIHVWLERPFAGAGLGSYPLVGQTQNRHPHNYFVELLAELGLIGLIVGVVLIAFPAVRLIRSCRRGLTVSQAIVGGIWLFLFSCAMASGDLTDNRMMFAFMGLVLFQDSPTPDRAVATDPVTANARLPRLAGARHRASSQPRPLVGETRC